MKSRQYVPDVTKDSANFMDHPEFLFESSYFDIDQASMQLKDTRLFSLSEEQILNHQTTNFESNLDIPTIEEYIYEKLLLLSFDFLSLNESSEN